MSAIILTFVKTKCRQSDGCVAQAPYPVTYAN